MRAKLSFKRNRFPPTGVHLTAKYSVQLVCGFGHTYGRRFRETDSGSTADSRPHFRPTENLKFVLSTNAGQKELEKLSIVGKVGGTRLSSGAKVIWSADYAFFQSLWKPYRVTRVHRTKRAHLSVYLPILFKCCRFGEFCLIRVCTCAKIRTISLIV